MILQPDEKPCVKDFVCRAKHLLKGFGFSCNLHVWKAHRDEFVAGFGTSGGGVYYQSAQNVY